MPVTRDAPAPYAPASAIIDLVKRYRNKGLPSPVDSDVLARAGISASLVPRTLQSLQALDLIDEHGAPSAILEGIRRAPEAEYRQRIADWLRAAYADALQFADPATATDSEIRDAFRHYVPIGQQERMVTLFTGLFREAGVGPERQRAASRKANGTVAVAKSATTRAGLKPPKADQTLHPPLFDNTGGLPPPIAGLLASLPRNGAGWSRATRNRFIKTFEAVLDFCIPTVEETTTKITNMETATPEEDVADSLNL